MVGVRFVTSFVDRSLTPIGNFSARALLSSGACLSSHSYTT
jgi:hypothetical protein